PGPEIRSFECTLVTQAVNAHDAAAGRLDYSPVAHAGERVGIDLAQIPLRHGKAVIAQQGFQVWRKSLDGARRAVVILADGYPELVPDVQQLTLAFTLPIHAP